MPKLFYLLIFSPLIGLISLQAQKLDLVQGDLIVQLSSGKDIRNFIQTHSRYRGKPTTLQLEDLLSKPLNIWKLNFDFAAIHDRNFLNQIQKDPTVIAAQFNHLVDLRSTQPNDPQFDSQWFHLNTEQDGIDLDSDLAWDITTGGLTPDGDTIVVCIIDNGQDLSHEDFGDNLWINHAEIPNNNIDDDNNGYLDDYRGWHTGLKNDNIDDVNNHGTPVSGIIGAKGNNNLGVSGVNWNVKLMTITAGFFGQSFDEAQIIQAYNYALIQRQRYNESNGQEGAFVVAVNSSFGIGQASASEFPVWCGLFEELGAQGILGPVAADDRNGVYDVELFGDVPAVCTSDFVIGVNSVDRDGDIMNFAFGDKSIDLAAFGSSIWTTDAGNSYRSFAGTSASAPMVAGAIALLYSAPCKSLITLAKADPPVAALLVKQYIMQGAIANQSLEGKTLTGGYLNLNNSLQLILENCLDCIPSSSITTMDIDDQSALIQWNDNPTILKTDLRWRAMDTEDWIIEENVTPPLKIEGLLPCSAYEFQLQDSCEANLLDYSPTYNFQTLGCCAPPTQVTFGIIEEDLALIQWPEEFGAEAYEFRYRELGDSEWMTRVTFNNNFGITRLDTCTTYQVQIAISCDGSDVFTGVSQNFTFTTLGCGSCLEAEYCLPDRVNASEEWIAMVKVNEFENLSQSDNGYGDYTDLSLELERGKEHEFVLETGKASGINRSHYAQIWIDLDQDGFFASSELLYESDNPSSEPTTAFINLPDNIKLGKTRLRVSSLLNSGIGACSFSSNQFGEFEDYCIDIIEKQITSIDPTQEQDLLFNLYPNPISFDGEITLNTQFKKALKEYSIEWMNSSGTIIKSHTFQNHPSNIIVSRKFDLSDFQQGIYFLRFRSIDRKSIVRKVIIVK